MHRRALILGTAAFAAGAGRAAFVAGADRAEEPDVVPGSFTVSFDARQRTFVPVAEGVSGWSSTPLGRRVVLVTRPEEGGGNERLRLAFDLVGDGSVHEVGRAEARYQPRGLDPPYTASERRFEVRVHQAIETEEGRLRLTGSFHARMTAGSTLGLGQDERLGSIAGTLGRASDERRAITLRGRFDLRLPDLGRAAAG